MNVDPIVRIRHLRFGLPQCLKGEPCGLVEEVPEPVEDVSPGPRKLKDGGRHDVSQVQEQEGENHGGHRHLVQEILGT